MPIALSAPTSVSTVSPVPTSAPASPLARRESANVTPARASAASDSSPSVESLYAAILEGDMAKMTKEQRLLYYREYCERLGLNPLSKPFGFFEMQSTKGKVLTIYALKEASNQLARRDRVSIEIRSVEYVAGANLMEVSVRASTPDGRFTDEVGCIGYAADLLKGDLAANQRMKGITKAKRRAILAHCGLGVMDETEVETLKGRVVSPDDFIEGEKVTELPAKRELLKAPPEVAVAAVAVEVEEEEEVTPSDVVAEGVVAADFDCTKPEDMDWLVRSIKGAFHNASRALVVPLAECLKANKSRTDIINELALLQKGGEPEVQGYIARKKK